MVLYITSYERNRPQLLLVMVIISHGYCSTDFKCIKPVATTIVHNVDPCQKRSSINDYDYILHLLVRSYQVWYIFLQIVHTLQIDCALEYTMCSLERAK